MGKWDIQRFFLLHFNIEGKCISLTHKPALTSTKPTEASCLLSSVYRLTPLNPGRSLLNLENKKAEADGLMESEGLLGPQKNHQFVA